MESASRFKASARSDRYNANTTCVALLPSSSFSLQPNLKKHSRKKQTMSEIQKLIELWNARPPRVEPDNEAHLLYLFTGLLPALRKAMPVIVALADGHQAPAIVVPSTGLPPAPAPEPNTHIQDPTPNTDGIGEASGPTGDNAGKPASLPAIVVEPENAA